MFQPRSKPLGNKKKRISESDSDGHESDSPDFNPTSDLDSKRKRSGINVTLSTAKQSENMHLVPEPKKDNSELILNADDAIRATALNDELATDARSQYERNREIQKKIEAGELEEGVYRGQKAYSAYVMPDDEKKAASAKFTGAYGPNRSMANIKTTSRFDYQMDICKDFKETGYCGFGDSCVFLHDRSDYKTGWELEREWEQKQKLKTQEGKVDNESKKPDNAESKFPARWRR